MDNNNNNGKNRVNDSVPSGNVSTPAHESIRGKFERIGGNGTTPERPKTK